MRIDDGHSTIITFSAVASGETVQLWEKEVTPPGIEGGGANDTTTMRNTAWRTKAPKKLKSLTDGSFKAAYDPEVLESIQSMHLVNQLITITFPDGSGWKFWGWLESFKPDRVTEGQQPTAECVIIPSNQNDSGVEVAPDYQEAA